MQPAYITLSSTTYPLPSPAPFPNAVYISPWTGEVWARICRRPGGKWWPEMAAAEGEPPYPYPHQVAGSLLRPSGDCDTLLELPRPLLLREFRLWGGLTSATESGDNCPTIEDAQMTPTLLQEIAALRAKAADGTITDDELRRALRLMREERLSAATRAATKKAAAAVNPDEALAAFLS